MRPLGAIIAGGQSRRFGTDKALAEIGGKRLLDHVADALTAQTDALIVVGREWPAIASIPDRPTPDQGPLGGLCAALHHARDAGYDAVLTAGCDILPVPDDLAATLSPGPAVVDGQPLLGLWPAALADALDAHLAATDDRSMRGWLAASAARSVPCDTPFHNLNTRADFALYSASRGLAA